MPEIAEVVSGRKIFKTAGKSSGRQILWKQLDSGSKKRSASRVIPTKSAKQINRSRRDIFTNISHYSCRVIFGTNLLWQFLEILEEIPSSWRSLVVPWPRNLSYYLTWWKLHVIWISNGSKLWRWFETDLLGFETETCKGSWLRNLQNQRSKKGTQWSSKSRTGTDGGWGGSSSSRYSCKQHFALNFFKCWSVQQQSANLQL